MTPVGVPPLEGPHDGGSQSTVWSPAGDGGTPLGVGADTVGDPRQSDPSLPPAAGPCTGPYTWLGREGRGDGPSPEGGQSLAGGGAGLQKSLILNTSQIQAHSHI